MGAKSNLKKIYVISSGNGGVGKSTITLNLALNLSSEGLKVGILDADVYGSAIPLMMNLQHQHIEIKDPEVFIPPSKFGIKVMSSAFIVPEDIPVILRGNTLYRILEMMIQETYWGSCDIFLIDLPPGTGEIPVYISQLLKVDGAIIVVTPQELSVKRAFKVRSLFDGLDIPLYGIIENMVDSYYSVFGKSRQKELSAFFNDKFLGSIPLIPDISSGATDYFRDIALHLSKRKHLAGV